MVIEQIDINDEYSIRVAYSGNTTYVGKSSIGSIESNPVWQIKRIDSSSGVTVLWCDGNANYDNIWSNYLSLSYS